MYMKETENDDLIYLQLPPTLVELTIINFNARLSFSDEVHDKILQSLDYLTICEGILLAPGSSLSSLKRFHFDRANASIFLFSCILELAFNLQILTISESNLVNYSLTRIRKLSKFKTMNINSKCTRFSITNFREFMPKKITELSLNYDYEANMWPRFSIISYGFKDLQKLTIQYNPNPYSIKMLIKGLVRLKHLTIIGKPYNSDIEKLSFQNDSVQELNLIHFQYSKLNFKIFNQWKGLKKIIIKLNTPMTNYYTYFELCHMLNNWKYCTFPNSVQFWNMNKD